MKFLSDENIPTSLVKELRISGFDVKDIKEQKLFGMSDKNVLELAKSEDRIVLTYDKDFLNLTNQTPFGHKGIIILRFSNQAPKNVIERFLTILNSEHSAKFGKSLVIISDNSIEIIKQSIF
ncbi:MAG: DUF5615 family PIN-like protein [Candidatus Micrarchaeota archaeon]|nr:DUF5615 family PIN-like protein [Candidatus Micrarchaeota archaeon]